MTDKAAAMLMAEERQPVLAEIAGLIRSGAARNIIVMAGAGISTRAGIPDFRSPDTGIYANLEKFKLPYPEAIFELDYFKENPGPFYTLAKELDPGRYQPTKTHSFFKLLEQKKILRRCFTQNIDTLERRAGLSDHLIVEAHGSFASAHCLQCRALVSHNDFIHRLSNSLANLINCLQPSCFGNAVALIKPDIVFFGEQLPKIFFERLSDFEGADMLIVLGTSLEVEPFASLVGRVGRRCVRLLMNLEPVGLASGSKPAGFRFHDPGSRDFFFQGTTDDGVEQLCELLGWKDELSELHQRAQNIDTQETTEDRAGRDIDDGLLPSKTFHEGEPAGLSPTQPSGTDDASPAEALPAEDPLAGVSSAEVSPAEGWIVQDSPAEAPSAEATPAVESPADEAAAPAKSPNQGDSPAPANDFDHQVGPKNPIHHLAAIIDDLSLSKKP